MMLHPTTLIARFAGASDAIQEIVQLSVKQAMRQWQQEHPPAPPAASVTPVASLPPDTAAIAQAVSQAVAAAAEIHHPPPPTLTPAVAAHPRPPRPAATPDAMDVVGHRVVRRCHICNATDHLSRACPHPHRTRNLRAATVYVEELEDLRARIRRLEREPPNVAPRAPVMEEEMTDFILIRSNRLKHSTEIPLQLESVDSHYPFDTKALLDSGAMGLFIDDTYVKARNLTRNRLPRAIRVYNIDGTLNEHGSIRETVDLIVRYRDHTERATFYITSLGGQNIILGHQWLEKHNPEIDWKTGEVTMSRCPGECRARHIRAQRRHRERYRARQKEKKRAPPLPAATDVLSNTETVVEEELDDAEEEETEADLLEIGDRIYCVVLEPEDIAIRAAANVSQRLAEAAEKHRLEKTWKEVVPTVYHAFEKVFLKESFDELPQSRVWDHAIELLPEAEPFSTKLYAISPSEQPELDRFLDENLQSGRIRPSKSPMASPVFFIKKKDGSLRLVQDYRKLNAITVKNSYPLPLIQDLMGKVSKAKIFTKLDVRWGYNNVRIKEGDEWKAAFRTNRGLFEPLVMFFGLTNSPATFQTMMNALFKELIDEGVVVVYIDDILVFTATLEEHRRVVRRVLEILSENNLFLKPEKCIFEVPEVEFLGLIISEGKVRMDPVKVAGVRDWPTPKALVEVQSFLGFANFYRRFIEDFSTVAHPLHALQKKGVVWRWGKEEEAAFQRLKEKITASPVLTHPDPDRPYSLETDSSDFATGAVLSQACEDSKWRPVGYYSKSLNEVERNYPIHDKEMLSVIRALQEWRHLLEGAKHRFDILNDHRNLTFFATAQNLNRRQARWSLYLSRFDFQLVHRPGKSSGKPDALSRRADHKTGQEDNRDKILLPSRLFVAATGGIVLEGLETELMERIKKCEDKDEAVVRAFKELGSTRGVLRGTEWSEEGGVILFNGKVYVPRDPQLRHDIVRQHHDAAIAGHPGRWKTLELVTRNFWWPGISRYVAGYVKGCDACNRTKIFPAAPAGRLMPNSIPTDRWQVVTVDLVTDLPICQGYDTIWVAVDRLSKRIHIAPTTKDLDSVGHARLFRDHVWRHHGLPDQVISDRGPQFVRSFTRELNRLLGIETRASTAFHPQTDGQTERVNMEIEQYLRMFCNQRQDDWTEWLPLAEFAYNNRVHSSTRHTPFELDTGRHPRMGIEPRRTSRVEAATEFADRMARTILETQSALKQAADDMARYYDADRKEAEEFKVGDKVWLDAKNIKTQRPVKKVDDRWFGPFKISKVVNRNEAATHVSPSAPCVPHL